MWNPNGLEQRPTLYCSYNNTIYVYCSSRSLPRIGEQAQGICTGRQAKTL